VPKGASTARASNEETEQMYSLAYSCIFCF